MVQKKVSQEFRLKNSKEIRYYIIKEIDNNGLISNKQKKVCTALNYIEHFQILASAITGCISNSAFLPLSLKFI